ncbi:MAG: DUF2283 domain-containing protein [Bacteroidota bacterium]
MRIQYNRKDDVLVIHVAQGKVDFAEELGDMIVHYSKNNKPLFIEVLDASNFLATLTKTIARAESGKAVEV